VRLRGRRLGDAWATTSRTALENCTVATSPSVFSNGPEVFARFCCSLLAGRTGITEGRERLFLAVNDRDHRQDSKGAWWMPWDLEPMKGVDDCDKPRGGVEQPLIRGCPNGETRRW
jgi:hypothetical protein